MKFVRSEKYRACIKRSVTVSRYQLQQWPHEDGNRGSGKGNRMTLVMEDDQKYDSGAKEWGGKC